MSSINSNSITLAQHNELLSKFPEQWKIKLTQYTGEELFYFYKLCCMTPKSILSEDGVKLGTKDMFFLSLKNKFYQYMNGTISYPIKGDAWIKLHHKFRHGFEEYAGIDQEDTLFNLEQAKSNPLDTTKTQALLSDKFKRLA